MSPHSKRCACRVRDATPWPDAELHDEAKRRILLPFPVRVLALQLKRIGDLALTTPALHAMRMDGAHVTLVVDGGSAALLPLLGLCADASLVYRRGGTDGGNGALWRRLLRGGFDACVDFTGRDRSALMTLAAHAPRRVIARQLLRGGGWRRPVYNTVVETSVRSRHTVDLYLDHLAPLGLHEPDIRDAITMQDTYGAAGLPPGPVLRLPPGADARAKEILAEHGVDADDPYIVIHPGSARAEKYWLPERWAEVITFCQRELGRRCVLTGGRDTFEQEHLARVRAALAASGETCPDLSGQLDLTILAAVLARASLFVGVDSGPMHLAAAWGRPQIVLFGPTNPFHWRPRRPWTRVLQAGQGDAPVATFSESTPGAPMDRISTRAVFDCIKTLPPASVAP